MPELGGRWAEQRVIQNGPVATEPQTYDFKPLRDFVYGQTPSISPVPSPRVRCSVHRNQFVKDQNQSLLQRQLATTTPGGNNGLADELEFQRVSFDR